MIKAFNMARKGLKALVLTAILALGTYTQAIGAATLLPPGEQCFQATTGINGMVGALGTITAGSGGSAGTYGGVALTGGSGSGATANIVVSGGGVASVTILNPGTQFVVGDVLSAAAANIGNVTGFSVPVNSVSINSSLAGGSVTFYIPNTGTLKQTWQNATQTTLNTNPVQLDQNGCAVIYGTGSYRQVVQDSLGNTVWDKLTTDTSANNNTFFAGTAGGSPNVITVVDPGFNATDGSIINFYPLFSNTGPATLNPSGFGNIPIVKDTNGGPIALTGAPSEIVASSPSMPNVVSVFYSAQQNNFHILNPPIASASGSTSPLCGASGLQIVNNTSTPNTIINMTATQAVMQSNAGLVINRSAVSLTAINISTGTSVATANGMDGEAAGISQWLFLWMIDNGAAPAGLVSTSSTAPTMPSGYTYKCRMGSMRVDGSGNLLRSKQVGQRAQYVISSTGTTAFPSIGTTSGTGLTSLATANFAPPTANIINVFGGSAVNAILALSANNQTAAATPATNPSPCMSNSPASVSGLTCSLVLEGANIFAAASSGTATVFAIGWNDAVNAN